MHPTGRCGVVITDQNRSLCTELGAANHYKLEHLKQPSIWNNVFNKLQIYFVGGYHLTVCPEAALALAKEAAAQNKVFAMSLSAPFIPTAFKDALDQTEPYWDYLVGNENEAQAWAEAHNLEVYFPVLQTQAYNINLKEDQGYSYHCTAHSAATKS